MQMHLAYIPTKDTQEAKRIGKILVEEKLAGCVNIIPRSEAIYLWEGELEESSESILIAKTAKENLDALTERVKELHSYDVPCVLTFPVASLNQAYTEWISRGSRSCNEK